MVQQKQRRALRSATATSLLTSQKAKPTISYREVSTEVESWDSETEDERDLDSTIQAASSQAQSRRQRPYKAPLSEWRRSRSPPRVTSTPTETISKTRKRKRGPGGDIGSPVSRTGAFNSPASSQDEYKSSTIPPWASLPYGILVLIFQYASYPLYDMRTFQTLPSVDWLLKASRLCRAFAEPSLTVLYRSPPLVPMERAHKLRRLLIADPETTSYNYRAKVERLQIEVWQTAAYTLPGSGLLDLYGLIYHCPRLQDLEIYHQKDFSPYGRIGDSIKWTYPDSLFAALDSNVSGHATKLRSWRWSSRLAGKKRPVESLLDIHQSPAFRGLRKIAFVNYQKVRARKNVEDPRHEVLLADSLTPLLDLEHLIFESSTLVNSVLLTLLPPNLKHLEIINCSELDSDDLAEFLISHGNQLRTLTLNHNTSLSLSFLKVLESSCQHLESLIMNLAYYNPRSLYRGSDSGYTILLGIDEVPQWPATLRTIELIQLRKWNVDIAKMFFQSLLENAGRLIYLRRLVIKAILNTSWRDRSSFRDQWIGAFERVFKRLLDPPPNPHFRSLDSHAENEKLSEFPRAKVNDSDNIISGLKGNDSYLVAHDKGGTIQVLNESTLRSINENYQSSRRNSPLFLAQNCFEEQSFSSGDRKESQMLNVRRSARNSVAQSQDKKHSNDLQKGRPLINENNEKSNTSSRKTKREQRIGRQLVDLRKVADINMPSQEISNGTLKSEASSDDNSDSDDVPLATRRCLSKGKKVEHIQGMCDVVAITIENLRPAETQFVEADFLDTEPEGDEDWDGSEELSGDGQYAW